MRSAVALAAAAILLGACVSGVREPAVVEIEIDPMLNVRPASDVFEVWSAEIGGASWRLLAVRSVVGQLCVLDAREDEIRGSVCGSGLEAGVVAGSLNIAEIAGREFFIVHTLVRPDVAGIRAAVPGRASTVGTVASLRRLGLEERFGAVLVPANAGELVIELLDGSGGVLEQRPLGPLTANAPDGAASIRDR